MNALMSWLNTNQGFVMSLLTLVYVLATIIIVLYNRKSINEMKEARESESRPYVFVYLDKDPRDLCFYLRIKNYGKSGAKLQSISISPKLKLNGAIETHDFLRNVVLAPSQTLEFIILEKSDETIKNEYSIRIQYSSLSKCKKQYQDEYTLVLQYARQMGYTNNKLSNTTDEANALKNIADYLDSMRRKM